MPTYELLKSRIIRKTYLSEEEMLTMLDTYYFVGRLTQEEFIELVSMVKLGEV